MATKRVLRDSVRLYNYIGEICDNPLYQESIIYHCYCPVQSSSVPGTTPTDTATLYLFDANTVIESVDGVRRTFVPPCEWEKCDKSKHFTLTDNGKDYFRKGSSKEFVIRSVSHKVAGSRRMWHFEVIGK